MKFLLLTIFSGKDRESTKYDETSKFLLDNQNLVSLSFLLLIIIIFEVI
jgi:hypothetical protein